MINVMYINATNQEAETDIPSAVDQDFAVYLLVPDFSTSQQPETKPKPKTKLPPDPAGRR